jgi:hypothetical protein
MSEIDFDRVLPRYTPPRTTMPDPQPARAELLWRLRAWELGCLPRFDSAVVVGRWLLANGIAAEQVSHRHDITVWRDEGGRREIGFRRIEHRSRKDQRWTVAIPMLVPLKIKPPVIRRRLFLNFDKFQGALESGHEGRSPSLGSGRLEPPACPVCSREAGRFVPWPCRALARWMPRGLQRQWAEHVEGTLASAS